jgi:DNA topoisomerase-1
MSLSIMANQQVTRAPEDTARDIGLVYVSDLSKGITRQRCGKGFIYHDSQDRQIRDQAILSRIAALVIPPAWRSVWICPSPRGHIQAVGRDDRGRKQYRYHPKFREVRDESKFGRMISFLKVLPRIRRRVRRDLARRGLPREKVLAAVVFLLETTLIRIGNEEYASNNGHYGLTTIQNRHAKVRGSTVCFCFTGKSGVRREVEFTDPAIARIVRKCQDLPGESLFEYLDDAGETREINSRDVNAYLREIAGADFTAKDFRTWAGSLLALRTLAELEACKSQAQAKRNLVAAIDCVAARLGNTRTICKKCYIHPVILDRYMDGELTTFLGQHACNRERHLKTPIQEEAALLKLLQARSL